MSKKKALGRGLSALLSDSPSDEKLEVDVLPVVAPSTSQISASGMTEIAIDEIEVNPFQPRSHFDQESLKELAESIHVHGIIQPITVRKLSQHQYPVDNGGKTLSGL